MTEPCPNCGGTPVEGSLDLAPARQVHVSLDGLYALAERLASVGTGQSPLATLRAELRDGAQALHREIEIIRSNTRRDPLDQKRVLTPERHQITWMVTAMTMMHERIQQALHTIGGDNRVYLLEADYQALLNALDVHASNVSDEALRIKDFVGHLDADPPIVLN
jgi:hypothetical protein